MNVLVKDPSKILMVGMRSDTRASTNSCQPLLDVSAGQTQPDPILQDSKM